MGIVRVLVVLLLVWFALVWGLQRRILYPRPPAPLTPPTLPANVSQVWLGCYQFNAKSRLYLKHASALVRRVRLWSVASWLNLFGKASP